MASGAKNVDDYIKAILNEKRLKERFEVFENITACSIENLTCPGVDLHFVVLISDLLPIKYQERLKKRLILIQERSSANTSVIKVKSGLQNVDSEVGYTTINEAANSYIDSLMFSCKRVKFATVRLDDDDALSKNYALELSKYIKEDFVGFPISFPYGYQGIYDNGKIVDLRDMYIPNIALGLAFINCYDSSLGYLDKVKNVYMLGNHSFIYQSKPSITDSTDHYYIRTINNSNDSGVIGFHKDLPVPYCQEPSLDGFSFLDIDSSSLREKHDGWNDRYVMKKRLVYSSPLIAKMSSKNKA